MTLIKAAEAPVFEMHGTSFTGLASPERGASENAVWRVKLPPRSVHGRSHQLTREETLVALAGTAAVRIGDARHTVSAGDAIIVPAFTDFVLDNPGDEAFEAVAVFPVGGRAMLPDTPPFTPPWAK